MSWLAQIIMFLVLGLFATPSQFPAICCRSVLLGLFLIFVARPIAVWLCLLPFACRAQETAFVSWVGLRGAVSILLAITPILGGLENGRDHLQHRLHHRAGLAGRAGLDGRAAGAPARPDRAGAARAAGQGRARTAGLGPSRTARLYGRARQPGGARRAHSALGAAVAGGARRALDAVPGHAGRLVAGDHVYIFVPDRYPRLLDRLFASRAEVDPEDADFFGAFAVDPAPPGRATSKPPTRRA